MASAASTVFVQQIYQAILLRAPTTVPVDEVNYWGSLIDGTPPSGGLSTQAVIADIINLPETQNDVVPIVLLYEDFYQRAPDYAGLQHWVNQETARGGPESMLQITTDFAGSSEFISKGLTGSAFITDMYFTMLGRQTDPASVFWYAVGGFTPNQVLTAANAAGMANVVQGIIGSGEYQGDLMGTNAGAPQLDWQGAVDGWLTQAATTAGGQAQASGVVLTAGQLAADFVGGPISGLPGSTIYATTGEDIVLTTSGAIINGNISVGPVITATAPNAIFSAVVSQDAGAQSGPTTLLVNDVLVGNGVTTLDVVLQSSESSSSSGGSDSSQFIDFDFFTFDGPGGGGVNYKDWASIVSIPNIILISDGAEINYWNAAFAGTAAYTDLNSDDSLVIYNLQSTGIQFTAQGITQSGVAFVMVFADSALSAAGNNTVNLALINDGIGFDQYYTEDGSGPGLTIGPSIFMLDTGRTHLGVNTVNLTVTGDNYIDTFFVGDNQTNSTLKVLNISGSGNLWISDQIYADTGSGLLTVNLSPYGGLGSTDSRNSTGNVQLTLGAGVDSDSSTSTSTPSSITQTQGSDTVSLVSSTTTSVTLVPNSTSPVIHFIGGIGPGQDTILLGDPKLVVGGIGFKQDTIQGNGGSVDVQVDISQGDQSLTLGPNGSFKIFTGVDTLSIHPLKGDLTSTTVNLFSDDSTTTTHTSDPNVTVVNLAEAGTTQIAHLVVAGDANVGGPSNNNITFNQATSSLTSLTFQAFSAQDDTFGFQGSNFATVTVNSTAVNANGVDVIVAPSNTQQTSVIIHQLIFGSNGTPAPATLTFDNQADLNGYNGNNQTEAIVVFDDILDQSMTTAVINSSTAPMILVFDSLDVLLQTINVSANVGPGQQVAVGYNPIMTTALHVNGNGGNFEFFGAVAGYNGILNINNTQAVMLDPLGAVSTINTSAMTNDVLLDFAGNIGSNVGLASGVNLVSVSSSLSIGFGDLANGIGDGPQSLVIPFAANIAMLTPGSGLFVELDNTNSNVNVALSTSNATSLTVTAGNLANNFLDLASGQAAVNNPGNFGGAMLDLTGAVGVTSVTVTDIDARNGINFGEYVVIGNQGGSLSTTNNPVAPTIVYFDASGFGSWINVNLKNADAATTIIGGQDFDNGGNYIVTAAGFATTVIIPNLSNYDAIDTDGSGNLIDPFPGVVTANLYVTGTTTLSQFGGSGGHALANITTENLYISGAVTPGGGGPVSLVVAGAADWRDDFFVDQNFVNTLVTVNVFGGAFNSAVQEWDYNGAFGGLNFSTYNAALFQGTSSLILENNTFNHTYIGGLGVGSYGPNTLYEVLDNSTTNGGVLNNLGLYTPTVVNFQDVVLDIQGEPFDGSPPVDTVNLATAIALQLIELVNPKGSSFDSVNVVLPNAGGTVVQLGDVGLVRSKTAADGITAFPTSKFDTSFSSTDGLPGNNTPGDYANIIVPNNAAQLTVNLAHTDFHGGNAPATLDINNQAGTALNGGNPFTLNLAMVDGDSEQLLLGGATSGPLTGAPVTTIVVVGGTNDHQVLDLMAANYLGTSPGTQYLPLNAATNTLNASGLSVAAAELAAAGSLPNAASFNAYLGSVWVDAANDPPGPFTFISGLGGRDWFIGTGTGFGGSAGFVDTVVIEKYRDTTGGSTGTTGTPGTGTTIWGGPSGANVTLDVLQDKNVEIDHHGALKNIDNLTVNMGFDTSLQYFDPTDLSDSHLQTLSVIGGNAGSLFAIYDYGVLALPTFSLHDPQDAVGLYTTGRFGLGDAKFTSFDAHNYLGTTYVVAAPDTWIATAAGVGSETMLGGQGAGGVFVAIADNQGGGYYGTLSAAQFGNWATVFLDSFYLSPITSSNTFFLPTASAGLQTVVLMGEAPATFPNFNAAWTLQLGDGAGAQVLPDGVDLPNNGVADNTVWEGTTDTPPTSSPSTGAYGGNMANVTLVNGTVANVIDSYTNDGSSSGTAPATLNIINATVVNILVAYSGSGSETAVGSFLLTGTPASTIYIAGGQDNEAAFIDLSNGLTSPLNPATNLIDALHPPTSTFAGNVPFAGPYSGGMAADFANSLGPVTVFTGLGQDNQFIGSKFADTFNITNFVDFFGGTGTGAGTYIKAGGAGTTDNLNVPFDTAVVITGASGQGLLNESILNFTIAAESTLYFGDNVQGSQAGGLDLNDPAVTTVKVFGGDNAEDSAFIVGGIASAAHFSGTLIDGGGVTNGAFGGPGFQSVDFSGFKGFVSVILFNDSTIAGHTYTGSATPTLLFEILDWVGSGVYGGAFNNITTLVLDNFEVAGGNDAFGPNIFNAAGFNNVKTLALTGSVYSGSGANFTGGPNGSGIFGNPNPALNNTTPINITNFTGGANGTVLQLGYDLQGDLGITDQSFSGLIIANVTMNAANASGILKVLLEDTAKEHLTGHISLPLGGVAPPPANPLLVPTTHLGGFNDVLFADYTDFLAPGTLNPTNAGEVDISINNGNIQSMLLSGSETIVKVIGDPIGVFLPNDGPRIPSLTTSDFVFNLTGLAAYSGANSLVGSSPADTAGYGPTNTTPGKAGNGQSSAISGNISTFTEFTIDPAHTFDPLYADLANSGNSFAGDTWVNFASAKSAVTALLGYGDGNIVFGSAFGSATGGFKDNFTLPNFDDNSWIFAGPSGANVTLYVLSGDDDLLNNLNKGKVPITHTNLTNETTENFILGNDVTLAFNGSNDLGGLNTPPTTASYTASISGTTMTASAVTGTIKVGEVIAGTGIAAGTTVVALGTGTGGSGTYILSVSQIIASENVIGINPPIPPSPWSHLTTITVGGGDAPSNGNTTTVPTAGSYFIANGAYGSYVGDTPLLVTVDGVLTLVAGMDGTGLFAAFYGNGGPTIGSVENLANHVVTQIVAADDSLENSRILSVIGPNPINPLGNNTVVTPQQTYIGGNGNLPVVTLGSPAAPNPNAAFARNEFVITFDNSDQNPDHGDSSNTTGNNIDPILTNWNDVLFLADDNRSGVVPPLPNTTFIAGYGFTGTTINAINFTTIGDYVIDGTGYFNLVNANAPVVLGGHLTFSDPTSYGTTFSGNVFVNLSSAYAAVSNNVLNVTLVDSYGNGGANGTAGYSPSFASDGTVQQINFLVPGVLGSAVPAPAGGPPNFGGVSLSSGAGGYQDLNLGGLNPDPTPQFSAVTPFLPTNHGLNLGSTGGTVNAIKITVSGGPVVTNPSFYYNPALLPFPGPTGGLYPTTPSQWVVDFTGSNAVGNPGIGNPHTLVPGFAVGTFGYDEVNNLLTVLQQATAVVDASGFSGAVGLDAYAFDGINGNTNGGVIVTGGQGIGNSFVGSLFNDVINDPNFTTLSYIDGDPLGTNNKDKEIANLFVQSVQTFVTQNVFGVSAINFIFGPGLPDPNNPGVLIPVTVVDAASGNLNAPPPTDLRTITVSAGTAGSYFIWNGVTSSTPTTVNSFNAQTGPSESGDPAIPEPPFAGNVQLELGLGSDTATGGGLINGNTFIGGSGNNNILVVEATNLLANHYYNGKVSFFQQVDFVTYQTPPLGGNVVDLAQLGTSQHFMGLNAGGFQSVGPGTVGAINVANGITAGNPDYSNVGIIAMPNNPYPSTAGAPAGTPTHIGIGDKLVFDNITEPPSDPLGEGPDPSSPPNPSGVEFNEGYQFWPNPGNTSDAFYGGQYLVVNLNATGSQFLPLTLSVDLNNEGYNETTANAHTIHFTGDGGLTGSAPQPFFVHGGAASGNLLVATGTANAPAPRDGSAAITLLTNGVQYFTFTAPTNDLAIVNGANPSVSPTYVLDFDLSIGLDAKANPPIGLTNNPTGSFTFNGGQTGGVIYLDHQSDTTAGDSIQSGIPSYIQTIDASHEVSDLIMAPDVRLVNGGGVVPMLTFIGYNQATIGVVGGWDTVEYSTNGDVLTGNANSIGNNWLLANHDATGADQYDLGSSINESLVINGAATTGIIKNFGLLDLSFLTNSLGTGATGTTATVWGTGSTLANPLGGTSLKGDTIIASHFNDVYYLTTGPTATGADTIAFDGNVYSPFTDSSDRNASNLFFNSNSGTAYTHINNFDVIRDAADGPNAAKNDKLAIDLPYSGQATLTGTTPGTTIYDPAQSLSVPSAVFGLPGDTAAKMVTVIAGVTTTSNVIDLNVAGAGHTNGTGSDVFLLSDPAVQPGNVSDLNRVSTIEQFLEHFNIATGGNAAQSSGTVRFVVAIADNVGGTGNNDAVGLYEVTANEGNNTTAGVDAGFGFGTQSGTVVPGVTNPDTSVDAVKLLGIATIDDVTHHFSNVNWAGVVSSQPGFV